MRTVVSHVAGNHRAEHAEGPCWHPCLEKLLWVDQYAGLLPGVPTGTEVQRATRLGVRRWVKTSPAAQQGSAWITALLAPFPDARGSSLADADDDAIQTLIAGPSPTPDEADHDGRCREPGSATPRHVNRPWPTARSTLGAGHPPTKASP